jgi:hypothetical protein
MQWHHLDCWAQKGKTADASTLFGFQALEEAQKQEVRDCLEATAAPDSEDGDGEFTAYSHPRSLGHAFGEVKL